MHRGGQRQLPGDIEYQMRARRAPRDLRWCHHLGAGESFGRAHLAMLRQQQIHDFAKLFQLDQ